MQSGSGGADRLAEPESGGVGKRDGGWRMEREREREVSAILHGPQRGHCPRRPSEDARIKAATWSPPPLITYSLLSPPLKCCQFTSLLSFSAELCFCYIKIQ